MLASTSTLHGGEYLGYLGEELPLLFGAAKEIVFVPFARPGGISHDEYTAKAAAHFATLGIALRGCTALPTPKRLWRRRRVSLQVVAIRFCCCIVCIAWVLWPTCARR